MNSEPALAGSESEQHDLSPDEEQSQSALARIAAYLDDAMIMRTAFYTLAFGVGITLVMDYREMMQNEASSPVVTPRTSNPVLPAFVPQTQDETLRELPSPNISTPNETLNQPMEIVLGANGVLKMTGFIDVGTAELFEKQITGISEYIKTVQLNSPGGSVFDALAISSKIREQGWETRVLGGNLCASSCPLIFAGGKKRIAEKGAGIGVHQFFSYAEDTRSAGEAISGTQSTTALITRHLDSMEVDSSLWVHAMETPPQQLYYFTPEELEKFKLVTQ